MIVWITLMAATHCLHANGHAISTTDLPREQPLAAVLDPFRAPIRTP